MTLFRPDLVYPRGATVWQCAGLVFWWLGLYFSTMCVLFGVAATLPIFMFGNPAQGFEILGKCSAAGALLWILGRAFLNLFSAR